MNEKFNNINNIGLEIEFCSDNLMPLLEQLKQQNINFILTGNDKFNSLDYIIIKPEMTVKGFEINIPPSTSITDLSKICNIFNNNVEFNDKCCFHIHTEISDKKDCDKIYEYYCEHEKDIIEEASKKELYNNLNRPASTKSLLPIKTVNMNVYKAFETHHTVEHRIYKATFNFDDICWCICQTNEIISKALSTKFKEKKFLKAIKNFRKDEEINDDK